MGELSSGWQCSYPHGTRKCNIQQIAMKSRYELIWPWYESCFLALLWFCKSITHWCLYILIWGQFSDNAWGQELRKVEQKRTYSLTDGHSFFRHGLGIGDIVLHDRLEQLILILTIKRGLLWNPETETVFSQKVKEHIREVGSLQGWRCSWWKEPQLFEISALRYSFADYAITL